MGLGEQNNLRKVYWLPATKDVIYHDLAWGLMWALVVCCLWLNVRFVCVFGFGMGRTFWVVWHLAI